MNTENKFIIGIPNLEKLNDEIIFYAAVFFKKKCPYCEQPLYEGNIREKYEIDHFFPISKGGQDFPWNILPVCKKCNRTKRDKDPHIFLSNEKYNEILQYLNSVKLQVTQSLEYDLQTLSLLKAYILNNTATLYNHIEIFKILGIEDLLPQKQQINHENQYTSESINFFFEFIQQTKVFHSKVLHKNIYFALNRAYSIYYNENPTINVLSKNQIKHFFKENCEKITFEAKPVNFSGNISRAITIPLSSMNATLKKCFGYILPIS